MEKWQKKIYIYNESILLKNKDRLQAVLKYQKY